MHTSEKRDRNEKPQRKGEHYNRGEKEMETRDGIYSKTGKREERLVLGNNEVQWRKGNAHNKAQPSEGDQGGKGRGGGSSAKRGGYGLEREKIAALTNRTLIQSGRDERKSSSR